MNSRENDVESEADAEADAHALPYSWLRFGGLALFVGGVVGAAQLATGAAGWVWLALAALAILAGMAGMAVGLRGELMAGRTKLTTPERSRLRFDQWHGLWVVGYTFSFIFAVNTVPGVESIILRAILIAVPFVLMAILISEFVRMVVRSDEHQRAQHVAASAIGGGVLIVAAAVWSMLGDMMGGWPSPPGWAFIPAFVVVYVLALSVLSRGEA